MAIVNVSKPTTTFANSTKINIGETWDSNSNQWQNESRTWDDMASIIDNGTKAFSGFIWATSTLPWQLPTPWIDTGIITNVNRP